jgi:hypothetical protein
VFQLLFSVLPSNFSVSVFSISLAREVCIGYFTGQRLVIKVFRRFPRPIWQRNAEVKTKFEAEVW